MTGNCPSTERLAAALRGRQSSADEAELAAHLAECPNCRTRLEELAGGSGWFDTRMKAHSASAQPASESLQTTMRTLASRSDNAAPEAPPQVKLDFLQPSDQPGVLGPFGPYEVLAQVAAGGMGIVLKARDPALNRIVALKILPPALAANSLARARFIREARAAAAVVHEHVVPIYAVDEFAGLPYLVMQFIEGRPLSERIRASGTLRLEEILRIGAQTAAGLAAAHAQGLIHRDVKPGNILLENGIERVKITDFGLARATDDSSLTREGYIAGTPEYMSPEQARNEPVDQRADLFSFGCVLYEMATGASPFRAEKPLVAMRRVCDEEPPAAHKLNPKIPEWLGQLIGRLMAKDAASRPQTAVEVAAELKQRLAESQQTVNPSRLAPDGPRRLPGKKRQRWQLAWAAVLLLFMAGACIVILRPRPKPSVQTKPPGPPNAQPNAPFVIPASGDTPARGFATFAEAVEAATPGAVIECRFNGPQAIPTVRRVEKALIIRAAPGFEPVLTPDNRGETMLFTHAPLVMEGLTLVTRPNVLRGPGRSQTPLDAAVNMEDAPLLATHCRIEMLFDSDSATSRQPHSVRLLNVPLARFQNCEFVSRTGFGLQWQWRSNPGAAEETSQLVLHGCTVAGNLMFVWRLDMRATDLELRQNTFAGNSLLLLLGSDARLPLQIKASKNLFDADLLVRRSRSDQPDATLPQLLRWKGDSNVYSVESYAQSSSPVNRHEDWLTSDGVEATNSMPAQLGIKTRLANLTERTRAAQAAAFSLTAEERQRLAAQGWTSPEPPGANPQKTGPGQPYHDWRNGPDYAEWLKLVREHVPQSAASP